MERSRATTSRTSPMIRQFQCRQAIRAAERRAEVAVLVPEIRKLQYVAKMKSVLDLLMMAENDEKKA
jgi:cob(I)alamin adenosyltransferase